MNVKPGCHPSLSAWGLGEVHVQNAVLLVGVASSDTMDNVVRADVVRFIAGAVVQPRVCASGVACVARSFASGGHLASGWYFASGGHFASGGRFASRGYCRQTWESCRRQV